MRCYGPLIAGLLALPVLAQTPAAAPSAEQSKAKPAPAKGYLTDRSALVALVMQLPRPPAPGSAAAKADLAAYKAAAAEEDGPRWQQARTQLGMNTPAVYRQLSCALGGNILASPAAKQLIQRLNADVNPTVGMAKKLFARPRPFTTDHGKACDPASADGIGEKLGFAYPSGHAAVGWLWALAFADVRPDRRAALRDFGQQVGAMRVVCRVHWQSDVPAGRQLGTQLHRQIATTAAYRDDVVKARRELEAGPIPVGCNN